MKANALDTLDEEARAIFPEARRDQHDGPVRMGGGIEDVPEPQRADDDGDGEADRPNSLPPADH